MKTITIITAAALALGTACTTTPDTCERIEGMTKEGVPIMIGEPCVVEPPKRHDMSWVQEDHNRGDRPRSAVSAPRAPNTPTSNPSTPPSEPESPPSDGGGRQGCNGRGCEAGSGGGNSEGNENSEQDGD